MVIDVVAAARRAAQANFAAHPWANPEHDVKADLNAVGKPVNVFDLPKSQCALGHENVADARFCVTCGLPMGAELPASNVSAERPQSAAELTEEERRKRDEQHAAAIAANQKAEQLVIDLEKQEDPSDKKLLIHFVSDGFTFAGRVWHIGDELEIGPDHPRWSQVVPWIMLTKREQVERYGKVFFDTGHWPYDQPAPGTEMALPSIGSERLFAMRRRQGSAVPARQGEDNSLSPI